MAMVQRLSRPFSASPPICCFRRPRKIADSGRSTKTKSQPDRGFRAQDRKMGRANGSGPSAGSMAKPITTGPPRLMGFAKVRDPSCRLY